MHCMATLERKFSNRADATAAVPVLRLLLLDFPPSRVGDLRYAAATMVHVIDVRIECRSDASLNAKFTGQDRCDVILVDSENHELWFGKLEKPSARAVLEAAIVIAGMRPLPTIQTALLHAGYADVMCVQETNAKTLIHSVIKSFIRNLNAHHVDMPAAVIAPIQRAMIKSS